MFGRSILKRRELILGLGSASFLAVPVFRETLAEAQGGAFPVRFVPIYLPGSATPGNYNFPGVLSPLASFQGDSIVFNGVANNAAADIASGTGEPHAAELMSLLTGDRAKSNSIDQIIADKISSQLKFTSLQFGVVTETASNPTNQKRMIYRGGTPQPPVENPAEMFTRLFGNGTPLPQPAPTGSTPPASASSIDLSADGKSMIDALTAEVTELKAVAGIGEQAKLDQHLTSLRELEKQIVGVPSAGTGGGSGSGAPAPSPGCQAPALTPVAYAQSYPPGSGPDPDIAAVTGQQFELIYQALSCDLSRVASMQLLGTAHTEVYFKWLGADADHHGLEHEQDNAPVGVLLDKVQTFFAGEIAKFLTRLKSTPEGSGTMLDNSVILFFTDFGNAAEHSHENVPFLTFGRAGGKITPGRTIDYAGGSHNSLLGSVLNVFGITPSGGASGGSPISLG